MKSGPTIVILLAITSGFWVNIYKFVTADFKPSYNEEIIRGMGILVPPVGMITGWMELNNEQDAKD